MAISTLPAWIIFARLPWGTVHVLTWDRRLCCSQDPWSRVEPAYDRSGFYCHGMSCQSSSSQMDHLLVCYSNSRTMSCWEKNIHASSYLSLFPPSSMRLASGGLRRYFRKHSTTVSSSSLHKIALAASRKYKGPQEIPFFWRGVFHVFLSPLDWGFPSFILSLDMDSTHSTNEWQPMNIVKSNT